jgi:hypothetical protein
MRRPYAPQTEIEKPPAEVLAPIPTEILDQIVRDGLLTAEEIETASRRFGNSRKTLLTDTGRSRSRRPAIARGRSSRG